MLGIYIFKVRYNILQISRVEGGQNQWGMPGDGPGHGLV